MECVDGDSVRLQPSSHRTAERRAERTVTRLKSRITWLESIVRERLPDVDLSATGSPSPGPSSAIHDQGTQDDESVTNAATDTQTIAAVPPGPPIHEMGLISVAPNTDQKYIGPSSGYFLARLMLASPQNYDAHAYTGDAARAPLKQLAINRLVDAVQRPLPLPPRPLANELSQVYFDIVHFQWPILHQPSFRAALDQLYSDETPRDDSQQKIPHVYFQVYMVLAISATVLSSRSKNSISGESYCLSALQYLDQLNVQTSLSGLQCMLLLLIYTTYSPHMRLNVWHLNYQCLAAVLDLGLQRNVGTSTGMSLLTQEMRTRIFWVVLSFDRTIATMMGRPIGLRDEACELRVD